ncbi:MAG: histone deacetylase [Chloroflexi bacterium]|nr:MAG: histone deacetylase [Chloroflexota bacterium]
MSPPGGAARILLVTDDAMDRHAAPGHPERPARRAAAAAGVERAAAATGARFDRRGPMPATIAQVQRIHAPAYLQLLADEAARGGAWLDGDTYLSPGSWDAALLAAGATVQVAEAVARGEATVAFAAVRPPGHHAAAGRGAGFCLINNIAVAVAALRAAGLVERVAIVDWDVHHGDGTQAIFDAAPALLYTSTHQFPFYPGTGARSEQGSGGARGTTLNRPLSAGSGDKELIAAWVTELLPAIEAFAPGAILVSAGYDAHGDDPLAELNVTERAYRAVAVELGAVARRLGLPGVALTLEGGYDLAALELSVAATIEGLLAGLAGSEGS